MDLLSDLLKRKAKQIDLDDKIQEIDLAAQELSRFYDKAQVSVVSLSEKTITVRAVSPVIASELRLSQVSLLEGVSKALNRELTRVVIRIGRK